MAGAPGQLPSVGLCVKASPSTNWDATAPQEALWAEPLHGTSESEQPSPRKRARSGEAIL